MTAPLSRLVLFGLLLTACSLGKGSPDTSGAEEAEETEAEADFHYPETEGYTDPGLPGWMGRTQISTSEGCWVDSDGVLPELAGCHMLVSGDDACSACESDVQERIGEACYTFIQPDGTPAATAWLIETNPGAEVCHPHAGGKGHPDVFDCDAYCKGTTEPESGEAYSGGACVEVPEMDCAGANQVTAYCGCTR